MTTNKNLMIIGVAVLLIVVGLSGCNEKTPIETGNDAHNTLIVNKPPISSGFANITEGNYPLSVNFTGEGIDTDGEIISFYWNFGDGVRSYEQNISHIFSNYGLYTVTLTVTDNEGDSDTTTIDVLCTFPIVTNHDLELLEWICEHDKIIEKLSNRVTSAVEYQRTYTMDDKGWELNELAEQYISEIEEFVDLSPHFIDIKNKYIIALEKYESVGRSAWVIAYDLENYNYNLAEIGIEYFPGKVADLNLAILDTLELMVYVENFEKLGLYDFG